MSERFSPATLLFALPSFTGGMGSAIDLRASMVLFNQSRNEVEADLAALRSDLLAVGQDMKKSAEAAMAELVEA